MPRQAKRSARIEARIAPNALRIVRRAAELQGRSLSDFIVAAAQEVAHRTIDEAHLIRLSIGDQERFAELLLKPPALAPALKHARSARPIDRILAMTPPFVIEGLAQHHNRAIFNCGVDALVATFGNRLARTCAVESQTS